MSKRNIPAYVGDTTQLCNALTHMAENRPITNQERAIVSEAAARLSAAEGCANWCDALIEMVEATSCDPDDPEAFDEVMMGARQFLLAYRKAAA